MTALREVAELGLFFLFGQASWLLVNSLFLQLPIFFSTNPEGYQIASYIALSVQIGNIFPLLYVYVLPSISLKAALAGILGVAQMASLLLVFVWDSDVWGHSVGLLSLTVLAGGVGGTSMVTIFPFASGYTVRCVSGRSVPWFTILFRLREDFKSIYVFHFVDVFATNESCLIQM